MSTVNYHTTIRRPAANPTSNGRCDGAGKGVTAGFTLSFKEERVITCRRGRSENARRQRNQRPRNAVCRSRPEHMCGTPDVPYHQWGRSPYTGMSYHTLAPRTQLFTFNNSNCTTLHILVVHTNQPINKPQPTIHHQRSPATNPGKV
jgi:hypothetical protein